MMEDFDRADLDGDGNIDFSEYIKSHTAAPPSGGSPTIRTSNGEANQDTFDLKALRRDFRRSDADRDGMISRQEFCSVAETSFDLQKARPPPANKSRDSNLRSKSKSLPQPAPAPPSETLTKQGNESSNSKSTLTSISDETVADNSGIYIVFSIRLFLHYLGTCKTSKNLENLPAVLKFFNFNFPPNFLKIITKSSFKMYQF